MKSALKSINITPSVGIQMAGYSERSHGADGIHDDLKANILVVSDGITKLCYVSVDLIGIDLTATTRIRSIVESLTDIKSENIMITATHTHSGVYGSRKNGFNFIPITEINKATTDRFYEEMIEKIAHGIIWANNDLEDSKIGFGKGEVIGFGTNRNDPDGYYDTSVNVIRINDMESNTVGIVVNHACHPTVLNQQNYYISSDYIGYLREYINKIYPNAIVVFSQGAAGSASTRYTKKSSSFKEANRLALLLSGEVIKIMTSIEDNELNLFNGGLRDLELNVRDFPSDEKANRIIEEYKRVLKEKEANSTPQEIRKAYVTLQGAERNLVVKNNVSFTTVNTQMQYLDFGVCVIVSIPGDVFGEIARDIISLSTEREIIVTGYTNDSVGYILSKEGFEMDCYEKNMTIFDESAHERIVDAARSMNFNTFKRGDTSF